MKQYVDECLKLRQFDDLTQDVKEKDEEIEEQVGYYDSKILHRIWFTRTGPEYLKELERRNKPNKPPPAINREVVMKVEMPQDEYKPFIDKDGNRRTYTLMDDFKVKKIQSIWVMLKQRRKYRKRR